MVIRRVCAVAICALWLMIGGSAAARGYDQPASMYDDSLNSAFSETVAHAGMATWSDLGLAAHPLAVDNPEGCSYATNTLDEFWSVSNVGPNRAGTLVPESFDIAVAGEKFTVVPNATKHMAEYASSHASTLTEANVPMSSFAGSLETAVSQGLSPGRNFIQIGPWELGIDTNANVIYHAVYRP